MGLDQFAYKTRVRPSQPVDFQDEVYMSNENNESNAIEIAYWRKHPNLHGWMEAHYISKGGEGDFNCRPVVLTREDLNELAIAVIDGTLPQTTGFFFGESDGSERDRDLAFIKEALRAIDEGYTVFYDSWH